MISRGDIQNGNTKLMYQPFSSILNPGFWQQLSRIKLNTLKLNTEPIDITGTYSCQLSQTLPCLASFDHSSFMTPTQSYGNRSTCPLFGQLICMNIMQQFVDYDKSKFLNTLGAEIWNSICDGSALRDPAKYLSRFGLLVFADLKKYKFFYWFSFPALNYPIDVQAIKSAPDEHEISRPITSIFSESAVRQFQDQYDNLKKKFQRSYFIVAHDTENHKEDIECHPLDKYEALKSEGRIIYFAYSDPSSDPKYPGWPLRNYLALIAVQFKITSVKLIRIRRGTASPKSSLDLQHSLVMDIQFKLSDTAIIERDKSHSTISMPPVTGWEKDETNQMLPKRVNLSNLLDPEKLADDAVNLNLKLMKWRLLPNLDLDSISSTRCLILGCGTLGCHVARGLLAWGIKNITLVDNSKISYSNPVRQTLYTFDDCTQSAAGKHKAIAAAESLKRIHPTVSVDAHVLSIPMPGHHVAAGECEQTRSDVNKLENLIKNHDVTFLLMDTRESRWLPSLIAVSNGKLVINAAIGFDTFLLQRYGIRNYDHADEHTNEGPAFSVPEPEKPSSSTSCNHNHQKALKKLSSDKLGCYFCNDIVAPGDSTIDRTLDQQCTVSRPGVSMIVSAMAVELLASVMSSSLGPETPAPLEVQSDPSMIGDEDFDSELGIVPHSIRGNLARYHIYMPTSPAFNKCSACSPAVVNAYRKSGFDFLLRVFDDPSYLEEIAGLADLQNVSDDVWALESDEASDELAQ